MHSIGRCCMSVKSPFCYLPLPQGLMTGPSYTLRLGAPQPVVNMKKNSSQLLGNKGQIFKAIRALLRWGNLLPIGGVRTPPPT